MSCLKNIWFSWYSNKQHDSHVDLKKTPLLNERKEIEMPTKKMERKIKRNIEETEEQL